MPITISPERSNHNDPLHEIIIHEEDPFYEEYYHDVTPLPKREEEADIIDPYSEEIA